MAYDEDAQAVGLEGVAGEPVTVHSLFELPYEQLVASAPAVGLFVEVLFHRAPDVGYDEPDVQLAFLGVIIGSRRMRSQSLTSS